MPTEFDINNLAIFSGAPAFSEALHVNKPWVGERDAFDENIDKIWDTKWFTNDGPLAQELEARLADKLNVQECVVMSSGTAALAVLLQVLAIKGEVILPSFTFISSHHTLLLSGLKPVFCDINLNDKNMSVEHCENLITKETGAIIPTHLWGRACDIEAFQDISLRYNIPLIFDAAHAFGCSHNGCKIGSFGDAEVFSFHATKSFHTAEGGAVTCKDPELAGRLRIARNFGFIGSDCVDTIGTNAKMSELSAAMGLTNLESFDTSLINNKSNYKIYWECLEGTPHLSLSAYSETESNNYWYISLELSDDCPISRDDLLRILHAENIVARRYFYPGCHKMKPYSTLYPQVNEQLPNTNIISDRIFLLPGGSSIGHDKIRKICDLLSMVLCHAEDIAASISK